MFEAEPYAKLADDLVFEALSAGGVVVTGVPVSRMPLLHSALAAEFSRVDVVSHSPLDHGVASSLISWLERGPSLMGPGGLAESGDLLTAIILSDCNNPHLRVTEELDISLGALAFACEDPEEGSQRFVVWLTCRDLLPVAPESMAFSDRAKRVAWEDLVRGAAEDVLSWPHGAVSSRRALLDDHYPHLVRSKSRRRLRHVLNEEVGGKQGRRSVEGDADLHPLLLTGEDGRTRPSPSLLADISFVSALLELTHSDAPGGSQGQGRMRGWWLAARMYPLGPSVWVDPYLLNAASANPQKFEDFALGLAECMTPDQELRLVAKARGVDHLRFVRHILGRIERVHPSARLVLQTHSSRDDKRFFHDRQLCSLNVDAVLVLPTVDRLIGDVADLGNYVETQPEINERHCEALRERLDRLAVC
ncbi:hypothetical protein WDV85_06660 [Pseudokineococcus sp. 5B2Z-1]|uniref:hypothetical protein n=1 Tax=Pseudokineococcus sp. 5B2Z-1 TaxID=3132744 RepID=UPI0030B376C9